MGKEARQQNQMIYLYPITQKLKPTVNPKTPLFSSYFQKTLDFTDLICLIVKTYY